MTDDSHKCANGRVWRDDGKWTACQDGSCEPGRRVRRWVHDHIGPHAKDGEPPQEHASLPLDSLTNVCSKADVDAMFEGARGAERCEDCGRPVAADEDWASLRDHECSADPCGHGVGLCWGVDVNCEPTTSPAELRKRVEVLEARLRKVEAVADDIALARATAGGDIGAVWSTVEARIREAIGEGETGE